MLGPLSHGCFALSAALLAQSLEMVITASLAIFVIFCSLSSALASSTPLLCRASQVCPPRPMVRKEYKYAYVYVPNFED